ncbi:MAG: hypothetical protein M1828_003316 [Chrysothrix sp. TS-e1954]|nr:MAG: hypothetical protein M1828_003316 [Chrysothrix sp. TS-e1954]
MAPKQYLAIRQGGPFELFDAEPKVPHGNEIVVAIKAIALNPLDWKRLYSGLRVPSWPALFGTDAAGVVEAIGDDVKRFKVGDEVLGYFLKGCFESHGLVTEDAVAHKPAGWGYQEAASIPSTYISSIQGIYGILGISIGLPGESTSDFKPSSILVTGGSSAFGAASLQLLRNALPDTTILTTSSAKHWSLNKRNGASESFDQKSAQLVDDIRAATPGGKGVQAILDPVNGLAVNNALFNVFDSDGPKALAEVVTGFNLDKANIPEGVNHKIVLGSMAFTNQGGSNIMPFLETIIAEGKYKLPIATKVVGEGLESIGNGLEELKAGVSGTKLVVTT